MKVAATVAALVAFTAALAGCARPAAQAETIAAATTAPGVEASTAAPPEEIPAALQGRWGLVPEDCEPGRADAKGLLRIGPRMLTFYEGRATIGTIRETAPDRLRADFVFSGEGTTWQREERLSVHDEGEALIRSETGEGASVMPLDYVRCRTAPTE